MLQESLTALKEILHKIDSSAYESALENLDVKKYDKSIRVTQPVEERSKLDQKWKTFTTNAKNKNTKFLEPVLPFKDDVILCEFNSVYKNVYDKEKFINS